MRAILTLLALAAAANAQKLPELGYIYPPGGKAGSTVEVRLGGFDWTPDMEFFTLDPRVKLATSGTLGPLLIPPPPYWFGAKGRLGSLPIPREVPAKITLPADLPPGPVYWQAANANGCTSAGVFIVGTGMEVVEDEARKGPQALAALPITVSGRLMKIEEVDSYRFVAAKDGPITCELTARRLGAKFLGVIEVRDSKGNVIADVAGTNGEDPALTFAAKAKQEYTVAVHDVDFGGDRSYVYRLAIAPSPRVVVALPAAGKRGETRDIEFIVDNGGGKLDAVKRRVTFPAIGTGRNYALDTSPPFRLLVSDLPETVAFPRRDKKTEALTLPAAVTGVLDVVDATDGYTCAMKKGEVWSISLQARRIGSPLDVSLAVIGPAGKELARNDDLPETTDAGLDFTAPADGNYRLVVSDVAGKSGTRAAVYRLAVQKRPADFSLQTALQRVNVPIGGTLALAVKAVRHGDCKGPISLTIKGLPAGVTAPPNLVIPAKAAALTITLTAAKDAGTLASVVTIEGTTTIAGKPVTRAATAKGTFNLAPRGPRDNAVPALLVATTMKPKFGGRPVDADTGRKVHRGSTHPADIIIDRKDGFNGEIILQMAAQQSYQVQGITGGDVVVPPSAKAAIYPCFMPEWLETSRTSRMGIIAVSKVADPKGKVRYVVAPIVGFVTMTMEGALLKLSAEDHEMTRPAGKPFDVRLKVSRLATLKEPVRLELRGTAGLMAAPVVVTGKTEEVVFAVTPAATLRGLHTFTIRATAMQEGKYAVVSEAKVTVELMGAGK